MKSIPTILFGLILSFIVSCFMSLVTRWLHLHTSQFRSLSNSWLALTFKPQFFFLWSVLITPCDYCAAHPKCNHPHLHSCQLLIMHLLLHSPLSPPPFFVGFPCPSPPEQHIHLLFILSWHKLHAQSRSWKVWPYPCQHLAHPHTQQLLRIIFLTCHSLTYTFDISPQHQRFPLH